MAIGTHDEHNFVDKGALVVDANARDAARLRHALEELGYGVQWVADTSDAHELLIASRAPVVTLFDVDLVGNALSGLDHADLLGALLGEADLVARHAYIVVSHEPESVAMIFDRVLVQLAIPVLGKNCSLDALEDAIAQASAHLSVLPTT